MSDKIKSCKPSLISNRADFAYNLTFTDSYGGEWEFEMHTMTAKERGAVMSSLVTTKLNSEGKLETEMESNAELLNTVTIYNAMTSWNIEEPKSIDNIDMLPKDVREFLVKAIQSHESGNDETLESEIKN